MNRIAIFCGFISILLVFPVQAETKKLEEILQILAQEHPESRSLAGLSHAHKSHSDASGILPDPKIGFAYRNFPVRNGPSLSDKAPDTPTMTGIELSVSQEFPFPGKLGTEKRISKIMENEANLSYLVGVNRLLGDFLIRLNRIKRAEKKRQINNRIVELLGAQRSISESYYSSGGIPLTGAIKASIAKTEAMERETELATVQRDLSAQLKYYEIPNQLSVSELSNLDLDRFFEESFLKLNNIAVNTSGYSIEETPDYKIGIAEEKRLTEQAKLAKYSIAPQTEVFFSYMKRRSQTFAIDKGPLQYGPMDVTEYRGDLFSFGVNMRVPVWSALNWSSVTGESEHFAAAGKDSAEKVKAQISSELQRNLELLRGISNQIQIVEKKLIPEMERAVRVSSTLYAPGKASIQDTLMAQAEVWNAKIRLEDLKEKKNETIITTLKLLSLIYEASEVPAHQKHENGEQK
ncbi:transporter [Leptospira perolatii]|uniref:Transporter n=1 Tax=Leptospira perolatii TaxID=2023191 RepID=A0A2M9ZLH6_9LEPT|nr:TolC family protein [Leptospira perolatii]PJZ70218.1 transporter [Leptospira perolatii]PJZ72897.1 transporter [Leptospira perolatii]